MPTFPNKDYYYAGIVMWLIGKHDRARDYIDKILKAKPQDKEVIMHMYCTDLM